VKDARTRAEVAREIAAELGRPWLPWRWQWRGRYVWWMQAAAMLALLGTLWGVWSIAGGTLADPGRRTPLWAAGCALVGCVAIALLAEAEARGTERVAERRRLRVRGIDPDAPMPAPAFPDGYVLAYELGGQHERPGLDGAERPRPFVAVAAIRADRWDLGDARWRFTLAAGPFGGVFAELGAGTMPAVAALGELFAQLDAGRLETLADVERVLVRHGARDVTSTYHRPAAG
jgi:hypothetical protein